MGHKRSALKAYMQSIGFRMPHSRPEKFLTGPFFFPVSITSGAISFDFQTGTNLSDPGLLKEFTGSETGTLSSPPSLIFHIERVSIILGDQGELLSASQMLELQRKTYLQTTISSQNRSYTLARNFETVGDTVATSVSSAERRTIRNESRAMNRPLQFDCRTDNVKILTASAVTGTPTLTAVACIEGAVWDPNAFENATFLESMAWDGMPALDNLKGRMSGASKFLGMQGRR